VSFAGLSADSIHFLFSRSITTAFFLSFPSIIQKDFHMKYFTSKISWVLPLFLFGVVGLGLNGIQQTYANPSPQDGVIDFSLPAVTLEQALHFSTPDGKEVLVPAGTYGLESGNALSLILSPETADAPITIQAEEIPFDEVLSAPVVRSIPGENNTVHIMLLMPTGKGLDSVGAVNAVETRGNFSFNQKVSSARISQTLVEAKPNLTSRIQRDTVLGKIVGETPIPSGGPTGLPGEAPFGVRALAVTYDPKAPNRQGLRELLNRPEVLRQAVNTAWETSRAQTCDDLKNELGKGNLIAAGVTLYDIVCNMGEQGEFTMQSQGASGMLMQYHIRGNYLEFTSTTPTALGSYADPRFSVQYDLHMTLQLSIAGGDRPLRVLKAVAAVQNAHLDSHGVVGDLVLTLGNFFTSGKLTPLAENAINSAKVDLTRKVSAQIEPANAFLKAPPGAAYAGHWIRRNTFIIAYVPLPGPLPPQTGWASGTVRWKKDYGVSQPPSCAGITFRSTVQTGPAPLQDPDTGAIGTPPTKTVDIPGTLGPFGEQGGEYTCGYQVKSLFTGIPNTLSGQARGLTTALQANNQFLVAGLKMAPMGWNGQINPTPGTSGKDYALEQFITSPGVAVITGKQFVTPKNPGDPAPFRRILPGSIKRQSGFLQQTPSLLR
jgi:hypothetical protein